MPSRRSPTVAAEIPHRYAFHVIDHLFEGAHGALQEIRRRYEDAATNDADNTWWQQRWIRFLIAHGTLAEARAAWQHAIRSIDPDGTKLRNSPWLALNLHFWVACRWLALGRLADVREVLAEVPQRWLDQEPELRDLVQVVTAQEQALALGESVYPASVPIAVRWRHPQSLPPSRSGHPLLAWAPGRIVGATTTAVTVVVAPTPDEAQQLSFDAETWRRIAGEAAENASGFFELGSYAGGEQVVRAVVSEGLAGYFGTWPGDEDEEQLLAALRELG